MNRLELIQALKDATDLSKSEAGAVVDKSRTTSFAQLLGQKVSDQPVNGQIEIPMI